MNSLFIFLFLGQNDVEKYKQRQNRRMKQVSKRERSKVKEEMRGTHVVYWQFSGNFLIFVMKTFFAIQSGSSSMVSEAVHSLVDTANAMVLYYGVRKEAFFLFIKIIILSAVYFQ